MSLKAGSRIRTYKPVVYKPEENSIVASDKNNDRKFMFLSEETQPDYRPMDMRLNEAKKPCPHIDHRPLGADSYSKVSIIAHLPYFYHHFLEHSKKNLGKFRQKIWE